MALGFKRYSYVFKKPFVWVLEFSCLVLWLLKQVIDVSVAGPSDQHIGFFVLSKQKTYCLPMTRECDVLCGTFTGHSRKNLGPFKYFFSCAIFYISLLCNGSK